ncbi:MAG: universal stress protein [Bacteroidetes bacterium]|nr:universal stress protein [Bacteroidota bacterium]MBS1649451.1 universal stress protein [Bacteroidota bacterium]
MKTILLPTDFSDISIKAAKYAYAFAKQYGIKKIILYHTYQLPAISGDPLVPAVQLFDYEMFNNIQKKNLQNFHKQILNEVDTEGIDIEELCEMSNLTSDINEIIQTHTIDIIITGTNSNDEVEDFLLGNNTLSIAKNSKIPVVIISPNTTFKTIKSIVLACDFKKSLTENTVKHIINFSQITKAKLNMLHISPEGEIYSTQMFQETKVLGNLFTDLQPEFYFSEDNDFMKGINDFAIEKEVDMIIATSKKHSLFEKLFKRSHLKQLVFHTHTPLMIIND